MQRGAGAGDGNYGEDEKLFTVEGADCVDGSEDPEGEESKKCAGAQ